MLLAFDIGNSNIHLGLWRNDRWESTWRARTVVNKMGDEYGVLVRSFLQEINLDYRDIKHVVIASVVPPLTRAFVELSKRYLGVEPLVVDYTNVGIKVDIELPEQAGADRIVNAAAVNALYGGPAIVIDFGTATNFDVVSRQGAYIGGAIAPGITIAFDALVSKTARLYKVDLLPPPSAIGRNTSHALQSGIFLGYLGLVEGLVARIKAAFPPEDRDAIKVIGTGGLAVLFKEQTSVIDIVVDSLTLDGLRVVWETNHSK